MTTEEKITRRREDAEAKLENALTRLKRGFEGSAYQYMRESMDILDKEIS